MLTGSMILLMFSEPPVAEASCYYILLYGFQDLSHHVTFIPIIAALGSLCTLYLSLCLLSLAEEGVVEGLYSPFVGYSVRNNKTASCVAMGTRQRSAESFQQPPCHACCTPEAGHVGLQLPPSTRSHQPPLKARDLAEAETVSPPSDREFFKDLNNVSENFQRQRLCLLPLPHINVHVQSIL